MVIFNKVYYIFFLFILFSCAANKNNEITLSQVDFNEALDKYNNGKWKRISNKVGLKAEKNRM